MRIYGSRISAHVHLQMKWKTATNQLRFVDSAVKITDILSSLQESLHTCQDNAAGWLFVAATTLYQLSKESHVRMAFIH